MKRPLIHEVKATVRCRCGENCEVTLKGEGEIEPETLHADLEIEAEEQHGWGDGGTCPTCQKALDADVAEVNAADAARMEGRAA